ncbi:hypothetical protein HPB50_016351 [Hyalomma asiaticum]|uniref:Uncharacterized protein n=1 Tax=Hyalomma asiaticum TaxID=266040 RepID=A0ACB7SNB6_HYAAI|nr:hypothetical protein HPB50_016351 [Hyalomma asiaticum]
MNEPNSVNAERKQRERHARFLRAARQGREKLDGRPALSLRAIAPVTFRTGRSRRREFARRGGRIVFVRVPEASPRGSLLHCPAEETGRSRAARCISDALADQVAFRAAWRARRPPRRPLSTPPIMQVGETPYSDGLIVRMRRNRPHHEQRWPSWTLDLDERTEREGDRRLKRYSSGKNRKLSFHAADS